MGHESEKKLEKNLRKWVKSKGGLCIKMLPFLLRGLPDRLCLLPGGVVFFVEVKSTGEKPSPVQKTFIKKLRKLGFEVYIIDNSDELHKLRETYS